MKLGANEDCNDDIDNVSEVEELKEETSEKIEENVVRVNISVKLLEDGEKIEEAVCALEFEIIGVSVLVESAKLVDVTIAIELPESDLVDEAPTGSVEVMPGLLVGKTLAPSVDEAPDPLVEEALDISVVDGPIGPTWPSLDEEPEALVEETPFSSVEEALEILVEELPDPVEEAPGSLVMDGPIGPT